MIEGRKVEKVGILLRPDGAVPAFPAVSVLLDGDHFGAAGWRTLPALEFDQLQSVLDLETDLDHVRYLFEETLFAAWLWNTTFIAIVSTAISLVCGVFAGYALSRLNFPFAGSLGTGIFITYLVPQTLLFIPLAEIIRNYRLGDTPWSLILTYPTFLIPFCTWLMMGYFKAVPKELEECARIDGASRWQAMLYIVIPVAIPGILSAGIFAFTLSWNEFIYALVFLSSPGQKNRAGRRHIGADPRRCILLGDR